MVAEAWGLAKEPHEFGAMDALGRNLVSTPAARYQGRQGFLADGETVAGGVKTVSRVRGFRGLCEQEVCGASRLMYSLLFKSYGYISSLIVQLPQLKFGTEVRLVIHFLHIALSHSYMHQYT